MLVDRKEVMFGGLGAGISMNGQEMFLMHQRAVFIPSRRLLLIADLHLGKPDSLRLSGIATPAGSSESDLKRLSDLLEITGANQLVILGDMLHGPNKGREWTSRWSQLVDRHPSLSIVLVLGNHDRSVHADSLGVRAVPEPLIIDSLRLGHDLKSLRTITGLEQSYVNFGGHVHPVVKIPGIRKRLPSFVLSKSSVLLPAFSEFTGGQLVNRHSGRVFVCCPEGLVELPNVR